MIFPKVMEELFPNIEEESPALVDDGGFDALSVVSDTRQSADISRIIQPKTVTYADFSFSKLHNLMFIHIKEELSLYVEKNIGNLNNKELIQIPLFCSHYPGFHGNTRMFFDSVAKLMDKANSVRFEWRFDAEKHKDLYLWMVHAGHSAAGTGGRVVFPKDGALFQQASVLIVNVYRCEDDTDKLLVDINPKLLPFLLYYGKGNGGTAFNRDVALKLSSVYSFSLYYFLCDWITSCSSKLLSLDELRTLLHYPEGYDVREINRRVLSKCQEELEAAGSDIDFSYEFKYSSQFGFMNGTRGRLKSNCVLLSFSRREKKDPRDVRRKALQVLMTEVADPEKVFLCEKAVEKVFSESQDLKMFNKFQFYYDRRRSHRISDAQYKNTLLKIIREMTGFDLRSDLHIRNAAISERRKSRSSSPSREPRPLGGIFGDLAGEE